MIIKAIYILKVFMSKQSILYENCIPNVHVLIVFVLVKMSS